VLEHDIEPGQGAADCMPVEHGNLAIERAFGQLAERGVGLPEQVAQLDFRAAQQFVGSQHLHILLHQFRPRQSRPSGGGLATEEAGASLETGTKRRSASHLRQTKPRNGAPWPKEGREKVRVDGGGGADLIETLARQDRFHWTSYSAP